MKYKHYVVSKTSVAHVFVFEDSEYFESNDLGEVEQIAYEQMEWDTVDTDVEYVGVFDEK